MPLLHCESCHHEYESLDVNKLCDWCGAAGYILAEKTSMEKWLEEMLKLNYR